MARAGRSISRSGLRWDKVYSHKHKEQQQKTAGTLNRLLLHLVGVHWPRTG
jgi:hypothetical protein